MENGLYKILLVEDNNLIASGLKSMLVMEGFVVFTVPNGLEALHQLKTEVPNLIISDIMMPIMNGYEFYENVLTNPLWAKIPFIFLTAKGEQEDIRRAKKMGVDDYLIKSSAPEDLLAVVHGKLKKANLIKGNEEKRQFLSKTEKHILNYGNLVYDTYQIIEQVGQGATAIVYKALHKKEKKFIALKELMFSPNLTEKEREINVNLFKQEAEILSKFDHPNIPKVYGYFCENDKFYIAMEFIQGEDLQVKIEKAPTFFRETQVVHWALQIAEALKALHDEGIVFRDLKPGNIILTNNDTIKLIDFGIARFFKFSQKDTVLAYTASYASPEQLRGSTDMRSDIFSFGACLHHLITLQPRESEVFHKIEDVNPIVSHRFINFINKCIRLNPDLRFQTMEQAQDALLSITENRLADKTVVDTSDYSSKGSLSSILKLDILIVIFAIITALTAGYFLARGIRGDTTKEVIEPVEIIQHQVNHKGMVFIPAANFQSNPDPAHPTDEDEVDVFINAFYIDIYEVTNRQYKEFVDATGHMPPYVDAQWAKPYNWIDGDYPPGKGDHPVVLINYHDAQTYARWVNKRLPTVEEWERAARGEEGVLYSWGNVFESGKANIKMGGLQGTAPETDFIDDISPYNVINMTGNVSEWCCCSTYADSFYQIVCGGSWQDDEKQAMLSKHRKIRADSKKATIGFRCALTRTTSYGDR